MFVCQFAAAVVPWTCSGGASKEASPQRYETQILVVSHFHQSWEKMIQMIGFILGIHHIVLFTVRGHDDS